jgi:hypothetical protein
MTSCHTLLQITTAIRTVSRQKNWLYVLKAIQNTLGGALSLPTDDWLMEGVPIG